MNSVQDDFNNIAKGIYATGDDGVSVDYTYAEGSFDITALTITLDNSKHLKNVPGKVSFRIGLNPIDVIDSNVLIVWTDSLGTVDKFDRCDALDAITRLWGWTDQYGVKACLTSDGELYFGGHDVVPDRGSLDDYCRRFWGLCLIIDQCWPEIQKWVKRNS